MKKELFTYGYVELIESWGSDERIIESARMSTNKGFLGWGPLPSDVCKRCGYTEELAGNYCEDSDGLTIHNFTKSGDEKLLEYLYRNNHLTPFEMCGATFEISAPIFVFREWHRHRTQSYNEMSARYIQMPNVHYVPTIERIMNSGQDVKNKQGSKKLEINEQDAFRLQLSIKATQDRIYEQYEYWLSVGISKEVARINTPVSRFSKMRASANLRNWLHFLSLRNDATGNPPQGGHAQFEIREYARIVQEFLTEKFPRSLGLFELERTT